MAALDERIKAQEDKLKQLKALKQKQEAQKRAAEAKRTRTQDTRRKVLVGAMMLEHMEKNEATKTNILTKLDAFLTRDDDRTLFGLYPKAKETITTGS
jgi:large subunit ribosomal protein L7/L12